MTTKEVDGVLESAVGDRRKPLQTPKTHQLKIKSDSYFIRTVTQTSTFKDFLLKEELMRAINEAGFEKPSEVQQKGIYYIIYGVDLLCQAKSGTGKTAVFVLGILQNTKVEQEPFQTLVICNTRELAFQITKEFERLGKYIQGLKVATIYGGVDIDDQTLLLQNNPPHILIGTPGRVLQLVRKDLIKLDNLRYFVIDECDEVLKQYGQFNRHETRRSGNFCPHSTEEASSYVQCDNER